MITKTYVVKMAAEGDAIQHRDFVSAEIEKITFVRPVDVLCIDRDVPDSRFMREDLYVLWTFSASTGMFRTPGL